MTKGSTVVTSQNLRNLMLVLHVSNAIGKAIEALAAVTVTDSNKECHNIMAVFHRKSHFHDSKSELTAFRMM